MKRKRLTAKRKSELCVLCGKCCMSMAFYGGAVDDESRDEIQWMELHGFKIDYVKAGDAMDYYFTIPQRCNALQETRGDDGLMRYTCGVYETRPQMCRDYDGSIKGPLGVKDCFWRLEKEGRRLPLPNLVRLEASR
ncbi:MAG TPA: YkgJ family cysteine cluster protein [Blastocatellia bacterium]|nr:YkgJ family cysteine cluster protein [Blastocatellia bacterium]